MITEKHLARFLVEDGGAALLGLLDAASEMRAKVERDGRTVAGSKGQPVAHPLLGAIAQLEHLILGVMGDCGFTPASRRRLGIELVTRKEPSSLDAYMARDADFDS